MVDPTVYTKGKVTFPKDIHVAPRCAFTVHHTGELVFGRSVRFTGEETKLACSNRIVIGDYVLFAGRVYLNDTMHNYEDPTIPIMNQGHRSKGPIIIESGCWVAWGAIILGNVTIGRNSVIGAGAVVTKDVPPLCVAAGNPAQIVKRYNKNTGQWEPRTSPCAP